MPELPVSHNGVRNPRAEAPNPNPAPLNSKVRGLQKLEAQGWRNHLGRGGGPRQSEDPLKHVQPKALKVVYALTEIHTP